jgi:hypothetical protein
MARPETRDELAEYCLRALGAPVLEINIDEDQIDDRIDEAIQFYQEYHSDAVVRTFVKHEITQDNIDNRVIDLPDSILSVTRIRGIDTSGVGGMFNVKYQMHLNDVAGLSGINKGGLVNYEMTKQHLSLIDDIINGHSQQVSYSRHKNTIKIHSDLTGFTEVGNFIIIECYQTVDPNTYPEVYNDMALKELLTLLIKKQWGTNLIKFEGMQLPGGVTISGRAIYDDAVNDLKELKERWQLQYENPVDFYCG